MDWFEDVGKKTKMERSINKPEVGFSSARAGSQRWNVGGSSRLGRLGVIFSEVTLVARPMSPESLSLTTAPTPTLSDTIANALARFTFLGVWRDMRRVDILGGRTVLGEVAHHVAFIAARSVRATPMAL